MALAFSRRIRSVGPSLERGPAATRPEAGTEGQRGLPASAAEERGDPFPHGHTVGDHGLFWYQATRRECVCHRPGFPVDDVRQRSIARIRSKYRSTRWSPEGSLPVYSGACFRASRVGACGPFEPPFPLPKQVQSEAALPDRLPRPSSACTGCSQVLSSEHPAPLLHVLRTIPLPVSPRTTGSSWTEALTSLVTRGTHG